jgi:hypothetical protein
MMCDVPSMAVFVGNILSVVLVLFPVIFVNFAYNPDAPNDYWRDKTLQLLLFSSSSFLVTGCCYYYYYYYY